jgi:hypothetical protein
LPPCGFQDYKFRTESAQHISFGGNQGVSVAADYVNRGQRKTEYLSLGLLREHPCGFRRQVPEAQLPAFQERFSVLIRSAVIPEPSTTFMPTEARADFGGKNLTRHKAAARIITLRSLLA